MRAASVGMATYVGGLSYRPKPDEGPLWFDPDSIGFGEDGPVDVLVATGDVADVVIEKAGRQLGFWPGWLLTNTFGLLGFLASRQQIPTTVVRVRTVAGETASFRVMSFGIADTARLLQPWLDDVHLPQARLE